MSQKYLRRIHASGFTLVELIVVITILVILGTIAFTSLSGFSGSARDGSRVSDLANLSKSLDIASIKTGSYPLPDNAFSVTYSGGVLWNQWTVWDTVMNILSAGGAKMNKKPTDPLTTMKEYTYSTLAFGNGYQIKTDYEGDSVAFSTHEKGDALSLRGTKQSRSNNPFSFPQVLWENKEEYPRLLHSVRNDNILIPQAQAASGNPTLSYIKGNYNGVVAKTQTGSMVYVLAIPSLFINSSTGTVVLPTASATGFYIHGQTNSGGIAFTGKLVYSSGSLPSVSSECILFASGIATAYSGTSLSMNSNISPYIIALSGNNTDSLNFLAGWLLTVNLGGKACPVATDSGWGGSIAATYTTGNDAYISRAANTTAQVGTTPITWDATKHWWKRTSDSAVLIPDKTTNGAFNAAIIEGTVQTVAYVANAAAESTYNKDQTNNLFVSPAVVSAYNYCKLLNASYAGNCNDATTLQINGGFQGTDPTLPSYHSGYLATAEGNLSYAGTAVYAGSEQFTPTATSKTSTAYTQYISRQSYNSNTSYCEQTYGTGWRLPTDYEAGHRNDTLNTGNGWNPAYAGSAVASFWTSSRSLTAAYVRWISVLSSSYWTNDFVYSTGARVRCVFFSR